MDLVVNKFNKESFERNINIHFNELIQSKNTNQSSTSDITKKITEVEDFFQLYDFLFYDIPKEGELSHNYIVRKSGEEIGLNFDDLLEELKLVREENLNLKSEILLLSNNKNLESLSNLELDTNDLE